MYLLNKAVTSASSLLFFLELHELEFAKRLEYVLQVTFSDAEMDVSYIKPMEWNLIRVVACGFRIPGLTVLLRFGELSDDGNA